MKNVFFIVFLSVVAQTVIAQHRSIEQSKLVVSEFAKQNNIRLDERHLACMNSRIQSDRSFSSVSIDKEPFYILTDTVNSCLYIVSADERMKDILGFSTSIPSNSQQMPDALVDLLNNYKAQYILLQDTTASLVLRQNAPVSIVIPEVAPLLSSKWDQVSPYNDLCPKHCPSGCVAMAMAQVMKYHKYPEHGIGSFSYISEKNNYQCSFDFETATFNWENMRDTYPSVAITNQQGRDDVAQLSYACGVSVGMMYDSNGSGAYTSDVAYALTNFFGYNENLSFIYRPYYKAEEWYSILCEELKKGRPVIYSGADSRNGGHAFVIDGCSASTRKFHVNWGWGGSYDGYYELDALNPAQYRFSSYQDMIIGVQPQTDGTHNDVFYAEGFSTSSNLELGKTVTFTITDVTCFSNQTTSIMPDAKFKGIVGIGVFDEAYNFIKTIDCDTIKGIGMTDYFPIISYKVQLSSSLFPDNGIFRIVPFVQSFSADSPTRIRTEGGKTDHITIAINGENWNEDTDEPQPQPQPNHIWSENFESARIPAEWVQHVEAGTSTWEVRAVLSPTPSMPVAASGQFYAYLANGASTTKASKKTSIVHLMTDDILLESCKSYSLSWKSRKKTSNPYAQDVLSIAYEQNNEWVVLSEIPITNQNDWALYTLDLPVLNKIRIAFIGCASTDSSIFLDDIYISEKSGISDVRKVENKDEGKVEKIFSLTGHPINRAVMLSKPGIYIVNGKKVIHISK